MLSKANEVLEEVCKTVVGKDEAVSKVLMAILAGGHILIDDIPGVGKTTMARAFAKVLGFYYSRVQFTPDVMPSDITGFNMYNRESGKFEFKPGAAMCNLLLADEINRTSPKTQSALLQIMEEGQMTVDGQTYKLPDPFVVIATQNPIGSVGTQRLPESQMDRFMVKISMGYPSLENEIEIMKSKAENRDNAIKSRKILAEGEYEAMRAQVSRVYVDDSIYDYVARIAAATRNNPNIIQGISPRGSIALVAMAKAYAFLSARDYCIPSDIRNIAVDTLAHRLVVNGESQERALMDAIDRVAIPKINTRR